MTESLLVTLTVDPGATDVCMGENMKFEMVIDSVEVVAPAPLEEPDAGELDPPPLLHAARSSVAPQDEDDRTTSAPSHRFPHPQTACDVGLNASGVPEEVCAPGVHPRARSRGLRCVASPPAESMTTAEWQRCSSASMSPPGRSAPQSSPESRPAGPTRRCR